MPNFHRAVKRRGGSSAERLNAERDTAADGETSGPSRLCRRDPALVLMALRRFNAGGKKQKELTEDRKGGERTGSQLA